MTDYEWLTQMGLCHKCRQKRVAPGKKFCFDCLEKISEDNAKRYDSEKAKAYQERRREIYREKKENGICVRCSKKASYGLYCYEHYIEAKRRSSERAERAKMRRHESGLIPAMRMKNGLCLWCGEKALDGTNVCELHSEIFRESGRKASEKDKVVDEIWRLKKAKHLSCI